MRRSYFILFTLLMSFQNCGDEGGDAGFKGTFYFGADLSYVNQILDHGGVYKVGGVVANPYKIFADQGTDIVRLRLWHNPVWTREVYEPDGTQMYSDLADVEKSMKAARDNNMKVLLDFHYSDEWADPGNQKIPAAWTEITDITDLADSVYNYTFKTLTYLDSKGLMPEFIQLGNETNCGMFYTDAPTDFPECEVCNNGAWANLRKVLNAGIKAVRDVSENSSVDPKIILHVADPVNVNWWFDNIISGADGVVDYDIIGFSFYLLWHTGTAIYQLGNRVSELRLKFNRDIMLLETAYPWTSGFDDSFNNSFGSETPVSGYPYSIKGQQALLIALTQEMIDGGGIGIFYWEPAWITSNLKTQWGTGSSWENCAFFDFDGNLTEVASYTSHTYK